MKDFNEIYQKTSEEVKAKLAKQTPKKFYQQTSFKIFFVIAIIVLIFAIIIKLPILFFGYLILALIAYFAMESSRKNNEFKEIVIPALVRNYDDHLSFRKLGSITKYQYNAAKFESYEIFHSEDSIQGLLDGTIPFNMSNILTQTTSTDEDGHTTYYTVFSGLFAEITLSKNTGADIFVHSDKGFIGKIFKFSNKIEMDSQEFEKSFDVTASDKIKAMQLLTSDVMADLIDFKNNSKKNFELSIRGNKLYFRFHCGNVFERAAFKDYLDYKTLYEYYNYLNFSCIVSKKIFNLVKETEL